MRTTFHAQITRDALAGLFEPAALQQVIAANVHQDDLINLVGATPHIHFDAEGFAAASIYIEAEHRRIVMQAPKSEAGPAMRTALGRLLHTAQDFYAHSNYVDLWLAGHGGLERTTPEMIDCLDEEVLSAPELHSGTFAFWRDWVFYVPGLNRVARRIHVPPGSHEAMHLDGPDRGPRFAYALVAARQRTLVEYRRAAAAVREGGGDAALARLQGREVAV